MDWRPWPPRQRRCRIVSRLAVGEDRLDHRLEIAAHTRASPSIASFQVDFAFPTTRIESWSAGVWLDGDDGRATARGHRVTSRRARRPDEIAGMVPSDRVEVPKQDSFSTQ